jgi:general secretion pathway protein G
MRREQGYSFVELLVVTAIMFILASAVMPLAQVTAQRQREVELRAALRQMRTAIDRFKDAVDQGRIASTELKPGSEGYPPDLDTLVEGVPMQNDQSGVKLKFLRRIPIDPMTNSTEWGLRAYQDRPDSTSWGGQSVFDVYTKSGATAIDGTKYKDW